MTAKDRTGRLNPMTAMVNAAIERFLRDSMFCLPGRITAFDAATQLAQIECGIQRLKEDGSGETITVVDDVPVHFPGEANWHIWHKIVPGETEGLIHFSQRAIDTWIDRGGPVAPHEGRMLSLDDAFFVPGVRSQQNKIPNFSNEGIGLSDADQQTRVELNDSAVTIHRDNGSTVVRLTSSGVGIEHNGEQLGSVLEDVVGVLDDTLSQLSGENVVISSGSSAGTYPISGQSIYAAALTDLQAVLTRLQTVLGG